MSGRLLRTAIGQRADGDLLTGRERGGKMKPDIMTYGDSLSGADMVQVLRCGNWRLPRFSSLETMIAKKYLWLWDIWLLILNTCSNSWSVEHVCGRQIQSVMGNVPGMFNKWVAIV